MVSVDTYSLFSYMGSVTLLASVPIVMQGYSHSLKLKLVQQRHPFHAELKVIPWLKLTVPSLSNVNWISFEFCDCWSDKDFWRRLLGFCRFFHNFLMFLRPKWWIDCQENNQPILKIIRSCSRPSFPVLLWCCGWIWQTCRSDLTLVQLKLAYSHCGPV